MNVSLARDSDLLFIAGTILVVIITIFEITTFETTPARVGPILAVTLILLTLIPILALTFLPESITSIIETRDRSNIPEDLDIDIEDTEIIYDINLPYSTYLFLFLVLYVTALYYIGFFTTTFVWSWGFIFWKAKGSIIKKFTFASLIASILILANYFLFVYLLRVSSVWRLGFLP